MLSRHTYGLALVAVLALALVLSGCGASPAETAPAATSAPVDTATAAPTATTVPPTAAGVTPAPTTPAADEDDDVGQVDVPGLNSYRVRTLVSSSGPAFEDDEDAGMNELVIEAEHVREPAAQRVVMQSGGEVVLEQIMIEGRSWFGSAGMWTEAEAGSPPDFTEGLNSFSEADIRNLRNLEKVGEEELHGFNTTHYRFDKESLLRVMDQEADPEMDEVEAMDGDFYISDEGIVVKWSMRMEGVGMNASKPEARGVMTTVREIYDVNTNIVIEPPATE